MCARAVRSLSVRIWPATKRACLSLTVEAACSLLARNRKQMCQHSQACSLFFKVLARWSLISASLNLTLTWLSDHNVTVIQIQISLQWNCFHLFLYYVHLTQLIMVKHQKLTDYMTSVLFCFFLYFCINTTKIIKSASGRKILNPQPFCSLWADRHVFI